MVDPDVAIASLLPTRPPLSLRERENLVNARYQHCPQVVGGEYRSHLTASHTLFPQQSRRINATEGFRLEVTSGCLWLTRLGDAVDRFLVAGSSIELHENHVLIQSDSPGRTQAVLSARYLLTPLHVPETQALDVPKRVPGYRFNFGGKLVPLWNLRTALVNF